jgi:phosphate transport system protein
MLRWLQMIGTDQVKLDAIHSDFLEMLEDGRHIFDAASNLLLGGGDPEVIRKDLFETDKRINLTEQKIRREIVVHGSVHGVAAFPSSLVVMSLVKDAERVGDYAKNLFDLGKHSPDLGPQEEVAALVALKDQVSKMLARAHGLFQEQDERGARTFLKEAEAVQKRCDADIERLISVTGENTASRVLTYRYFKRVASHAANVVTSIVMPVDKLDYYPGRPQSEQ